MPRTSSLRQPESAEKVPHRARGAGLRGRGAAWGAVCGALLGWGCGGPKQDAPASATASVEASASAPPVAPAAPAYSDEPRSGPAPEFVLAGKAESGCEATRFELAQNLLRGELALAGRPGTGGGEIAASWLIQLQNKAQIGFAGFDGQARRIARDRGIGNARENPPRLFATGDVWTVVWFEARGLAFAQPRWEAQPPPEVSHFSPLADVPPEQVALALTPNGSIVVASSFGTGGSQLSLFLFESGSLQRAQALGVTKTAKKPRQPAVSADAAGYTVAWLEEGGVIQATRFNLEGKEVGDSSPAVGKPGARSELALAAHAEGNFLTWLEDGEVRMRDLDKDTRPTGEIVRVGKGKFPSTLSGPEGALLAYVGEADGAPDQLLALRLTKSGPSASVVRVSESGPVLDRPALAFAGNKVAFAWTEQMNPAMAAKRAWLRTVAASCIK